MEKSHDKRDCAREVIARCQTLARFSEDADSIRRTFLSPPMRECHREIEEWAAGCGTASRVDAAGNLRIIYPAAKPNAPRVQRLLIGSHLDTVPNAGAYDGILGVVLAIAVLDCLNGRKFPFAIEVVGFSDEEGVRFGVPFIGSRALAGSLDEELLNRQDAQGISVRKAIADFGLNPAEIPQAAIGGDVLGYLEFHIEQGPGAGECRSAARGCRGYRRPEPSGVHIHRPGQSCGDNADESPPRCSRRRGRVDQRSRAPGADYFRLGSDCRRNSSHTRRGQRNSPEKHD